MKVAIYTRVSTLEQAQRGYSIRQQKDRLKQFAELNDWKVYKVYEDAGWSGTNTERPALQELLTDCKGGHFERVIVFKLDRLSRSVPKTYELFEYFDKHNIKFISITEGFDTSTAYGKAMSGFLSVMAQMENSVRVERSSEGKLGKVKRGEPMTGHNPPFGYLYDKQTKSYLINEEQANVIREIYDLYLSGMGGTELVAEFNSRGHVGKSVPWNRTHIKNILTNVVYIGKQKYKGEIYEANHEPIVNSALFYEVQREIEKRETNAYKHHNPRPWKSRYILSGLLRCGECGSRMEIRTSRWENKDGTKHINDKYRCIYAYHTPRQLKDPTRIKCASKKHSREDLEAAVIRVVSQLKLSDVDSINTTKPNRDFEAEIKRLKTKQNKLKHLYLEDLLGFEQLKTETEQIKMQLKKIESDRAQIEDGSSDNKKIKELISNGIDFSGLATKETNFILNTLIDYVSVSEDKLTFFWNF